MKLLKDQTVTVLKDFTAQGKEIKSGKVYRVYMGSEKKAAALLIELTKAGKDKSVMNMNNVRAMHESQIDQAVNGSYIEIKGGKE